MTKRITYGFLDLHPTRHAVCSIRRGPGPLQNDYIGAADFAFSRWKDTPAVSECLVQMATVGAGTPSDPGWAAPLTGFGLAGDFLQAVRARTVVDRLIGTRRAPFRTRVPVEVYGPGGAWIAPGAMIPLSQSQFESVSISPFKAAVMIALTGELLQSLSAAAVESIRESMISGVTQFLDQQFLDPSIAAVEDVSPASITHDGVEIISSGSTAAAIAADLASMISAADEDMVAPTWVMRARTAAHLAGAMLLPVKNTKEIPTRESSVTYVQGVTIFGFFTPT